MNADEIRDSIMQLKHIVRENLNENEQVLHQLGGKYETEISDLEPRKPTDMVPPVVHLKSMTGRQNLYETMGAINEGENEKSEIDRVLK